MKHEPFYSKEGDIIVKKVLEGKKREYRCAVDLKKFYNDLFNFFYKNKEARFMDSLGPEKERDRGHFFDHQRKEGEFVDDKANFNRKDEMYEKKFTWAKNDGSVEFELIWEAKAKTPHSAHGWFTVKIDLVNRRVKDVEIERNGKKEKRQDGTWEFRNEVLYKNNMIPEYVSKIPFIKNSESLQELYINNIHLKRLEEDYEWCTKKIKKPLIAFVESYFAQDATK